MVRRPPWARSSGYSGKGGVFYAEAAVFFVTIPSLPSSPPQVAGGEAPCPLFEGGRLGENPELRRNTEANTSASRERLDCGRGRKKLPAASPAVPNDCPEGGTVASGLRRASGFHNVRRVGFVTEENTPTARTARRAAARPSIRPSPARRRGASSPRPARRPPAG